MLLRYIEICRKSICIIIPNFFIEPDLHPCYIQDTLEVVQVIIAGKLVSRKEITRNLVQRE